MGTSLDAPQTRPGISTERTDFSSSAMSVSSSQGLTSRVTTDYSNRHVNTLLMDGRIYIGIVLHVEQSQGKTRTLAATLGLLAFFALYAATRSALTRSASSSSSSSEPKRSTSSSSSSSFSAPPRKAPPAALEPGRVLNSAS